MLKNVQPPNYLMTLVTNSFQPEDFATDAANEKYAELAMQIGQVRGGTLSDLPLDSKPVYSAHCVH